MRKFIDKVVDFYSRPIVIVIAIIAILLHVNAYVNGAIGIIALVWWIIFISLCPLITTAIMWKKYEHD